MVDSDGTEFTFHIDLSIPDEDRTALLSELSSPEVGAKLDMYGAGPMEEIMAAVTLISTAMSAGQIARTFVSAVIRWRQRMRQKGVLPRIRIERRGNGSINLEVESDEAVIIFITNQMVAGQESDVRKEISDADSDSKQ